jgi:hypothetical protein
MKKYNIITFIVVALVMLAGCNKEENTYLEDTKYLSVRLQGSDKWSILDIENGQVIAKDAFMHAPSAVTDDMFFVPDSNGRYNYYNVADCKKPVNSEQYGSVTSFSGGYAVVSKPGKPLEVIDTQCNTVAMLSPSVLSAGTFRNGRSLIHTDLDRYGYIDTKGDTVIAPKLGFARPFLTDPVALVSFSNAGDTTATISVIDINGTKLCDIDSKEYQILTPYYRMGVLAASKKDSIVYLDKNGKETTTPLEMPKKIKDANYRDGRYAGDGKYMIVKGDRMGLVDNDNKVLIPIEYQYLNNVTSKRYIASKDSVMVLLDDHGKPVGNAKFVDYKQLNAEAQAVRGYINAEVTAANLLSFIDESSACGAHKGATLMDMNQLVGVQPAAYLGMRRIDRAMPPMFLTYHFDSDIARLNSATGTDSLDLKTLADTTQMAKVVNAAEFNYQARVTGVSISFAVTECAPGTEERLYDLMSSAMGTKGFALNTDGSFTSSAGTRVVMGYENGVFELNYYFNPADAQPLPRSSRSK